MVFCQGSSISVSPSQPIRDQFEVSNRYSFGLALNAKIFSAPTRLYIFDVLITISTPPFSHFWRYEQSCILFVVHADESLSYPRLCFFTSKNILDRSRGYWRPERHSMQAKPILLPPFALHPSLRHLRRGMRLWLPNLPTCFDKFPFISFPSPTVSGNLIQQYCMTISIHDYTLITTLIPLRFLCVLIAWFSLALDAAYIPYHL